MRECNTTGQGKIRFTVVCLENDIIINSNTRINSVSHDQNGKPTFAPPCIVVLLIKGEEMYRHDISQNSNKNI